MDDVGSAVVNLFGELHYSALPPETRHSGGHRPGANVVFQGIDACRSDIAGLPHGATEQLPDPHSLPYDLPVSDQHRSDRRASPFERQIEIESKRAPYSSGFLPLQSWR